MDISCCRWQDRQGATIAKDKQSGNWTSWAPAFAAGLRPKNTGYLFAWTVLQELQKTEHTQRNAAMYTLSARQKGLSRVCLWQKNKVKKMRFDRDLI